MKKSLDQTLKESDAIILGINEDQVIKQFIIEIGRGGLLTDTGKKEWSQFMGIADHPTHWILIIFNSGYPIAKDNGYNLCALPKKSFSPKEADEFFQSLINMGRQLDEPSFGRLVDLDHARFN